MLYTLLPLLLMIAVLIAIIFQKIGPWVLPIWLITLLSSLLLIITGTLSPIQAINAIDVNVISYLAGLFIITQFLEQSHILDQCLLTLFSRVQHMNTLILLLIFVSGIGSALLMNDTIAIIGVPVILLLARQQAIDHRPLLITLALSITLGSVFSPIGNPQNMIIASYGMQHPFITFFSRLVLPGLLSLLALYVILRCYYRGLFRTPLSSWAPHFSVNLYNTWPGLLSVFLLFLFIIFKESAPAIAQTFHFTLGNSALFASLPVILFSRQRQQILQAMDWRTLLYFMGLFILMAAIYHNLLFQTLIQKYQHSLQHQGTILGVGLLFSQLFSNVTLVLLYLPQLQAGDATQLLTLAIGSTLAGNILVTGAASNIIIVQNTRLRKVPLFSFRTFSLLGIPATFISTLIYLLFMLK